MDSSLLPFQKTDAPSYGRFFLVLLFVTQAAVLVPVFLEEYLIAVTVFGTLLGLLFILNTPGNGLVVLPLFLFFPFEIPGLGGVQFSEVGVFLVLLSFVFATLLSRTTLSLRFPAMYAILAMLVASVFSVMNADYPVASVKQILKFIEAFILVFVFTVNFTTDRKTIQKILSVILVAATLSAVVGVVRFLQGYEKRVYALVGGNFGAYCGIGVVIALNMLVFARGLLRRTITFAAFVFLTGALILSQTRAWIAGTILAILFLLFRLRRRKAAFLLALFVVVLAATVIWSGSQEILDSVQRERIAGAAERAFETGLESDRVSARLLSLFMRLSAWINGFAWWISNPVFGGGIGNLRFKNYFTGELGDPSDPDVGYVDNHWLNVLYETGIVGLVAWIWFAVILYKAARTLLREATEPEWQMVALSLSGALIILLVGSMFWTLGVVHEMTVFVAFLSGLIFASLRLLRQKATKPGDSFSPQQ